MRDYTSILGGTFFGINCNGLVKFKLALLT